LALLSAVIFSSEVSAQKTDSLNVTENMVEETLEKWCRGLEQVGAVYMGGGDYKTATAEFIDSLYDYQRGIVLFKPTLATGETTFRLSRDGAISYFAAGNPAYKDSGFALKGWRDCKVQTSGILLNGTQALFVGKISAVDKNSAPVTVDKSFGFRLNDKGEVKIVLHHSSLPYEEGK
jgi:hypothetical protein